MAAKVIAHLLGAGANPNIRNEFGNTPLHNAASNNVANLAATVALLKGGADPNVPDNYDDTPLHYAAANKEDPGILGALLEAGADPNARFKNSDTPLHKRRIGEKPRRHRRAAQGRRRPPHPGLLRQQSPWTRRGRRTTPP